LENNPVDQHWWPSEFGRDDQPGATNYITEQKRLDAVENWGIGAYDFAKTPSEEVEALDCCHMNLTVRRGIYLMENLNLKQLSDDEAHEFLFAWAPLKLVGATGSPGNPIAAY
jgi:kynurenine formamidase